MNFCKIDKKNFNIFIAFYLLATLSLIIYTPLTISEANLIYSSDITISNIIVKFLFKFSHENYILRLPFFLISILSIFLLYQYSRDILNKQEKYFSIFLYLATPGVFVSNIIINRATVPIFLSLLFIVAIKKRYRVLQVVSLVLLFFTHTALFVFYLAIFLYAYQKKDSLLFIVSFILLLISIILEKYTIGGLPRGHLVQLFGIYAVIFSPFYFLALVYSLYRLAKDRIYDVLWYIVVVSFIISLILSIRQKILITDFTPFMVFASPLIVKVFQNSLSVRLPEFRKKYYILCKIVVIVLLLETLFVAFSYPIYKYTGKKPYIIDTTIYKLEKIAQKNHKKCINNISTKYTNLYKYYKLKICK